MRFAQKNCAYAHVAHTKQLRLRSLQPQKPTAIALTPFTHKAKTTLTLMSHTQHTITFPPPTIALKPYKTKRFTAKSQDFLSFLYINNNQTNPQQCHISSETTLKSHGKTHIKSIFKSPNCIEKHTVFERSAQNHRKTVKHSKFFYKN